MESPPCTYVLNSSQEFVCGKQEISKKRRIALLEVRTISIEHAAKLLAKELKATEEFSNLRQAQARIKLDPAAQDIMAEIEQTQVNIQEMLTDGLPVDEELQKLYQLQHKAVANQTLAQYFTAQETFSEVMKMADQIINEELE